MKKEERHVLKHADIVTDLKESTLGKLPGCGFVVLVFILALSLIPALGISLGGGPLFLALPFFVIAALLVWGLADFTVRLLHYRNLIRHSAFFIDAEPSPLYNTEVYYTGGGRYAHRIEHYRFVFPNGKWEPPQHPYPCLGEESLPNMNPERNKELHGQKYYLVRSKRGKILYAYPVLHFTLSDELSEHIRTEVENAPDL